jgi:hypothetical protein
MLRRLDVLGLFRVFKVFSGEISIERPLVEDLMPSKFPDLKLMTDSDLPSIWEPALDNVLPSIYIIFGFKVNNLFLI